MGKYVKKSGQHVKIGTCESLYYTTYKAFGVLRFKGFLSSEDGNDLVGNYMNGSYRFRFPFADEDQFKMFGLHENYDRGLLIQVPKSLGIEIAHGETFYRTDTIEKKAPAVGFRLPCIQSEGFPVKRFDWEKTQEQTIFEIIQQKPVLIDDEQRPGMKTRQLQLCVRCPYCGEICRLDKKEMTALIKHVWKYRKHYTYLQVISVIEAAKGYRYYAEKLPEKSVNRQYETKTVY